MLSFIYSILLCAFAILLNADVTNGLILHYTFDNDAFDYSGFGNHGTEMGSPIYTAGTNSNAISLNGSGQYVAVSNIINPAGSNFTVSFWANGNSMVNEVFLCMQSSPGTNTGDIWLGVDGTQYIYTTMANSNSGSIMLGASQWFHIVLVSSNDTTWDNYDIYINGVWETGSTMVNHNPLFGEMFIGSDLSNDICFNGLIDDFRIYDRPLSSNEIIQLFTFSSMPMGELEVYQNSPGPMTNVPPGTSNVTIMNLHITSPLLSDNLDMLVISNQLDMDETDISNVKLWVDNNISGMWDAGDGFAGELLYDIMSGRWSNNNIMYDIYNAGTGNDFVITMDVSPSAVPARSFAAYIEPGWIVSESNAMNTNIISNDMVNIQTIISGPMISNAFHVSTIGNDTTGDGTEGNPFLTLQKACDMLMPDFFTNGDFHIYLDGGIYMSNVVLTNSFADMMNMLVITAWTNGPVTLSNMGVNANLRIERDFTAVSNIIFGGNLTMGSAIELFNASSCIIEMNYFTRYSNIISLMGAASNNIFSSNSFTNNFGAAFYLSGSGARYNMIEGNDINGSGLQQLGIQLLNASYNLITNNIICNNTMAGIRIQTSSMNNEILNNDIYGNASQGIYIYGGPASNYIAHNMIYGQNTGIMMAGGDMIAIHRNIIVENTAVGVQLSDTTGIELLNNTIVSNGSDGVRLQNSAAGVMYNNIIFGNTGYGLNFQSTNGMLDVDYNCYYMNSSGSTNDMGMGGTFMYGMNNTLSDPLLDMNFEISSGSSAACDTGTNIPGVSDIFNFAGPDMGWKESSYSGVLPVPTAAITNPLPDIWLTQSAVAFSGTAAGNGGTIAGVYFSGDGITYGLASGTLSWFTNVDIISYADSSNVFYVLASNDNGKTFTNSQTNKIDLTGPVMTFDFPISNATISGITNISGTATETFDFILGGALEFTNGSGSYIYAVTPASGVWTNVINTSLIMNGYYNVILSMTNEAGLVSAVTQTNVLVTNDTGVFVHVSPVNGAYITGTSTTITGYIETGSFGVSNAYFKPDGGSWGYLNLAADDTNWWTNINTTIFTDGSNAFWYMFIDDNDITNDLHSNWYVVDNSIPLVGITNIASGDYISGTFTFSGTNSDPHSGILGTIIYITNALSSMVITNMCFQDGSDGFSNLWNSGVVADGAYYVYAETTNNTGLTTASAPTVFIVNNTDPIIIETNVGQYAVNAGTIFLTGFVSNVYSGMDPMKELLLNTNGGIDFFPVPFSGVNWWTNISTSGSHPDGTNIFTFYAVNSNDRTNIYSITNIIDNSAPLGAVTNNVDGSVIAGSSVNISGTNYENVSAITANVLLTNGGVYKWTNVSPWVFNLDSKLFNNGPLELKLVVSNSVGLIYMDTWTNYVSNGAPVVTIASPVVATPAWLTSTPTVITGYVTSAVGAVTTIEFRTNGGVWSGLSGTTTNFYTNFNINPHTNTNVIWQVRAINEYAVGITNTYTNRVDLTPPVISFNPTINDGTLSGITNISGTASETFSIILGGALEFTNGGSSYTYVVTPTIGVWTNAIDTSALMSGYYNVILSMTNEAGLVSAVTQTNVLVTNSTGIFTHVSPVNLAYVTGVTTITGYITPGSFGVSNVYMKVNAGLWGLLNGLTNWSTNFNTASVADGSNQFDFMYIDNNSVTNDPHGLTLIVDNSVPSVAITNLTVAQYLDGIFTFRGTNYDLHSGIVDTKLHITNTSGVVTNIQASITGDEWDADLNTTLVQDGMYYAYAATTNNAGLSYPSPSIMFIVNNNPPVIMETNTAPFSVISNSHLFAGYATNVYSAIDPPMVYYKTNGGMYNFITNSTMWSVMLNTSNFINGEHEFSFIAVSSNNKTNLSVTTNYVSNAAPTPPTASFTGPVSATINDNLSFTGTSTPGSGAITNYYWDLGNTMILQGAAESNATNVVYTNANLYWITLTVYDDNGLTDVYSNSINITNIGEDSTAPVMSTNITPNDSLWNKGTITLQGTIDEPDSALTVVYIQTNGGVTVPVTGFDPGPGIGLIWSNILDTTALADGQNFITIYASNTGASPEGAVAIYTNKVDNTPPAVTNLIVTVTNTTNAEILYHASDNISGIGYFVLSNITLGQLITNVTTNFNFTGLSPSTLYNIGVRAFDLAQNGSAWSNISFTTPAVEDVTAPVLSATITPGAALWNKGTITLQGTIDEPDSALTVVNIQTNGGVIVPVTGYDPGPGAGLIWTNIIDTATLSDGVNIITIYATNTGASPEGASYSYTNKVDNTIPTASVDQTNQSFISSIDVTLSASDNISINKLYYTTDGSAPTIASTQISNGGIITVSTTLTLKCIAEDLAGNLSTNCVAVYSNVGPTNLPPVVSLASPVEGTIFFLGNAIDLAADASDPDGSITKVEFFEGVAKIATKTSSPYTHDWTPTTAGEYELSAKAYDNDSAFSNSASVFVSVIGTGFNAFIAKVKIYKTESLPANMGTNTIEIYESDDRSTWGLLTSKSYIDSNELHIRHTASKEYVKLITYNYLHSSNTGIAESQWWEWNNRFSSSQWATIVLGEEADYRDDKKADIDVNTWTMFTVPYDLGASEKEINTLFSTYGDTAPLLFYYTWDDAEGTYIIPSQFEIGSSFWIRSDSSVTVTLPESTTWPVVSSTYTIDLDTGWNMVGSPFPFPFETEMVVVEKSGVQKNYSDAVSSGWIENEKYCYTGNEYVIKCNPKAWEGFWWYANSSLKLIITPVYGWDYVNTDSSVTLPYLAPLRALYAGSGGDDEFFIRLTARAGSKLDKETYFGTSGAAHDDIDLLDSHEPPVMKDYLSIAFRNSEQNLARDVKSPVDDIKVWIANIRTDQERASVTVAFDFIKRSQHYRYFLLDIKTGDKVEITENMQYSYMSPAGSSTRPFKVIAAALAYADAVLEEFGIEKSYAFPNPAFEEVRIAARMKSVNASGVLVKIFDMAGRQLRAEHMTSDDLLTYYYDWDLTDMNGAACASGVYIYKVSALSYGSEETERVFGRIAVVR
ncbi:right-handed parallel beta-helix repeat-containing protein [Spirochaetota bacterium]